MPAERVSKVLIFMAGVEAERFINKKSKQKISVTLHLIAYYCHINNNKKSPFLSWRLLMYNTRKYMLFTTMWAGAGVMSLLHYDNLSLDFIYISA